MATTTGGAAAAGPAAVGPSAQAAGTGGQPSAAPKSGNSTPAKDVEVIDKDGASLGTFDSQGKPVAPNITFTTGADKDRTEDSANSRRRSPRKPKEAPAQKPENTISRDSGRETQKEFDAEVQRWVETRRRQLQQQKAQTERSESKAGTGRGPGANASATREDRQKAVPEHVASRFVRVKDQYFFQDKTLAFEDHGAELATRSEQQEVVSSLVAIAQARDWSSVNVRGSEEFRRATWLEASMQGIEVQGYAPTREDKARLAALIEQAAGERSADLPNGIGPGDHREPSAQGRLRTPYFVVKEYRSAGDGHGVTHTFQSIDKAISKAEALGKTHLDSFDEHGDWHPISKGADGAWTRRQTVAERISADGIERDQVATPGGTPTKPAPERSGLTPNQATALEALKAVLKERGDSDKQIAAVAAVAVQRFKQLQMEQGLEPVVQVYDRAAPRPVGPVQSAQPPSRPRAHERSR